MNQPPASLPGPFDHIAPPSMPPPTEVTEPELPRTRPGPVIALTLCIVALVLVFNWWILTSQRVATAYLHDALARITEIDRVALDGETQLRATAVASPDQPVQLRAYPIAVDLPADFAANASLTLIRDRVLDEAAVVLYRDGPASLREDEPAAGGSLTAAAAIDRALSAVSPARHRALTFGLLALGLIALGMSALVVRGRDKGSALPTLGLSVAAGAGLVVVGTLAVWGLLAIFRAMQGEVLAVGILALAGETVMLFFRISLIIALGGMVIAVAGPALQRVGFRI